MLDPDIIHVSTCKRLLKVSSWRVLGIFLENLCYHTSLGILALLGIF